MSLILTLSIFGTLLILVEIFFVPGLSVAGIVGFIFVLIAGILLGQQHGALAGTGLFVGVMLMMSVAFFAYLRSPASKFLVLKDQMTARSSSSAMLPSPGSQGSALTPLRPAGRVQFEGKELESSYEASSEGEFIEAGRPVIVSRLEGSRIFVKQKGS
jgi:membrane-bound ClpP family serine protease